MREVFIDCGTNLCQGLNQIMKLHKMDESWIIYSFEVNPITFNSFDKSRFPFVKFINKGVWSEDCVKDLTVELVTGKYSEYDGEFLLNKNQIYEKTGGSSNILGQDWIKPDYIPEENITYQYVSVECINLSKFISDNFDKTDHIILKLDVEGAEYTILEKMLEDETIEYISEIYVEWHQGLLRNNYNQSNLIEKLISKNIKIHDWN